ncbi:MAG: DUF4162 domain-containing protein, partial [Clostridiales bacterium]|nr:DUF4162 domain-containing protein [Clostridiales bacterium]
SHYMEEVEQICTRIAILDRGRCIALGSKEELKNMINIGEKITIESISITDKQLEEIKDMEKILDVTYNGEVLYIASTKSSYNLVNVLGYLKEQDIHFGKVYTERPTLNDVFLELTGTELRD